MCGLHHSKRFIPYVSGTSSGEAAKLSQKRSLVKLSSNESAYGHGIPNHVFSDIASYVSCYPDTKNAVLLKQLSEKYAIDPDRIVIGSGSDEIFQMCVLAYASSSQTDEVVSSDLTFSMYGILTNLCGGNYRTVPVRAWHHDLDAMLSIITKNTKIIFIANPNNPTGLIIEHEKLISFLSQIPKSILCVIDEAYAEYVVSEKYPDFLKIIAMFPHVLVTRTFSKIYGLAGARIGYGMGSPEVVSLIRKVHLPFNVNSMALQLASHAFENHAFIQEVIRCNALEKQRIYSVLDTFHKKKLQYIPSEGNFICLIFPCSAEKVYQYFLKHGIIVRSLVSFGLVGGIRITVGKKLQNDMVLDTLSCFFENLE